MPPFALARVHALDQGLWAELREHPRVPDVLAAARVLAEARGTVEDLDHAASGGWCARQLGRHV